MKNRLPLLLWISAVAVLCLLLWEVVIAPSSEDGADSDAVGALDEGAWLEAQAEAAPASDGAPTLSGFGRRPAKDSPEALAAAEAAAARARRARTGKAAQVPFEGQVRDANGGKAGTVRIVMRGPGGLTTIETDEDGAFEHPTQPGRYSLLFDGGDGGSLLLRSYMIDGEKKDDLEFALREPAEIAVKVLRGKEGVQGTAVALSARDLTEMVSREATTDDHGLATFEGLPPGRYDVTAQVPEGPLVKHSTWASGSQRRDVNVRVPDGTKLAGIVRSGKEGPGVAGARITVHTRPRSTHGIFEATVETGADGRYEIVVPRGKPHAFLVEAEGWAPWPDERRRRVVLRSLRGLARKNPVKRDVILLGGATVSGVVQDEDEKPIPAIALRFKPRTGLPTTVTTTDKGTYAVANLNPGRYVVQVETPAYFPVRGQVMWLSVPGGAKPKPQTLDITLVGARRLDGTVVTADAKPAPGARVWIVGGGHVVRSARDSGRLLETFTDEKGRWVISDIPPDKNVSVRAAMGLLEADPIAIRYDKPPTLPLELNLGSTGTLRGTVVDIAARTTVRGARVLLRPEPYDGRTGKSAVTDANGEFVIEGLLPGTWNATPSRKGYLKMEPESVDVPGRGEVRMTLQLDPGEIFAGTVVDERGKPLWARVTVLRHAEPGGKSAQRGANSNRKGAFRLTGFRRGRFQVTVWRRGYKAVKLDLRAGDTRMNVVLRRGGRS